MKPLSLTTQNLLPMLKLFADKQTGQKVHFRNKKPRTSLIVGVKKKSHRNDCTCNKHLEQDFAVYSFQQPRPE